MGGVSVVIVRVVCVGNIQQILLRRNIRASTHLAHGFRGFTVCNLLCKFHLVGLIDPVHEHRTSHTTVSPIVELQGLQEYYNYLHATQHDERTFF